MNNTYPDKIATDDLPLTDFIKIEDGRTQNKRNSFKDDKKRNTYNDDRKGHDDPLDDTKSNMSYSMHIDKEQMKLMSKIRQRSSSKLPSPAEIFAYPSPDNSTIVGDNPTNIPDQTNSLTKQISDMHALSDVNYTTTQNIERIDSNDSLFDVLDKVLDESVETNDETVDRENRSGSVIDGLDLRSLHTDKIAVDRRLVDSQSVDGQSDDKQSAEDTSSFDVDEIAHSSALNEQIAQLTPSGTIGTIKTLLVDLTRTSKETKSTQSDDSRYDSRYDNRYDSRSSDVYSDDFDRDLPNDVKEDLLTTSDSMMMQNKRREGGHIKHAVHDHDQTQSPLLSNHKKLNLSGSNSSIVNSTIGPIEPLKPITNSSVGSMGVSMLSGFFSGSHVQVEKTPDSSMTLSLDDFVLDDHDDNSGKNTGKPSDTNDVRGRTIQPVGVASRVRDDQNTKLTKIVSITTPDLIPLTARASTSPPNDSEFVMINDANHKTTEKLRKLNIETRRVSKWVEDTSVAKCFNCATEFTILLRRHHCRLCGRVFCYYCSNYFTQLPLDILNKIPDRPQSFTDLIWGDDLSGNVRVCGTCFSHASKLIRIRKIIKVFELCQFTIRDLVFLSKLSPDWEDASKFLLSKFREIQYKLSIEELTSTERQMLWVNRNFIAGHSRWMVQLVKATNLQNEKAVVILEQLMYKKKKNRCWDMMCTRFCSETVGITDMLDLIRYNNNYPVISNFIVKCLSSMKTDVIINYLPFMVYNIENNEFILDILLHKGVDDFKFMSNLYWCIKVYCPNADNRITYIVRTLTTIRDNTPREFRHRFKEMVSMEKLDIKWLHLLNEKENIVLPLCHDKKFVKVDDKNVKIMSSYSQPAIIYFYDSNGVKKPIMFKNDDVRKDYIVLGIINIIHDILKREEKDMDIDMVRYEVTPTSKNTGYIEIVENASTIFNIIENSGLTIQNYILNHNKNQVIATFRERFIMSTALYCVVSYLLGIGDRHLDNIMISKDGLLFHIDFGFILGQDPKYSNNRLIRVTPEIINVIGGYGTDDYAYFKETCVRIYNRLRLHVNLFSNLLSIIPSIDPSITVDVLKRELTERFEIGENCLEAATHMDTKVDSKNNFEYMVIDLLYKSKQSKLFKGISYVSGSIMNAFTSNK